VVLCCEGCGFGVEIGYVGGVGSFLVIVVMVICTPCVCFFF